MSFFSFKKSGAEDSEAPPARSGRLEPIDRLPPAARKKLLAIRQQREDAFSAYRAISGRAQDLTAERRDAERRLRMIQVPKHEGGHGEPDDSPAVRELTEQIDKISSDLAELREAMELRGARSSQSGAVLSRVEDFLKGLPAAARIVPAPTLKVKPARGEDWSAAVERKRARLRELAADAHRARSAPLPAAVAKKLAREQIDALSERGAISVAPTVESGDPFRFPQVQRTIMVGADGGVVSTGTLRNVDVEGVFAWVFKDQLLARIDAEIDAVSDDANALTVEARAAKFVEIESDKLLVEREEECLIVSAEECGMSIARRPDADPLAVLGVVIEG